MRPRTTKCRTTNRHTMQRWILAGVAIVMVAGVSACGGGSSTASSHIARLAADPIASTSGPRTITVSATGKVTGKPDTLTLSVGVQSSGSTAQSALNQNNDRATSVIASLKSSGVSSDDIQTSELSISPTFNTAGTRITGYQVSNMVTAKLHQIDAAGKVIDAAAQVAGDNIRVNGVQFSIEDTSKLADAARADAIKQARQHASDYANAAGVSLGALQKVTETESPVSSPLNESSKAAGAAASTPVEAGTQDLTVQITVVYAIG